MTFAKRCNHRIQHASCILLCLLAGQALAQQLPVRLTDSGQLEYVADELGNRIPDFSHCGYRGGNERLPTPVARILVEPQEGDDGPRIQAAIDHVANLPVGDDGFRGAVILSQGTFEVAGDLRLDHSGVVLRGSGADEAGTTIVATGTSRRPLIRIEPQDDEDLSLGTSIEIVDEYVPVGTTQLRVAEADGFSTGDRVLVTRPSTDEWIEALGARAPGVGWRAGRCDIRWDRVVTAVDGNRLTLDAPLTTALEKQYGGGTVARITVSPRIRCVGVENLSLVSAVDSDQPSDEEHSWFGVVANHVEDAWVRCVRCTRFAGGAILLREGTKWVTVEDCLMLSPVSELGGYRRHSFFTQGQQTLFLRCYAEQGRHDFAVGHCAPGPNAFVNCYAHRANADSGPLESWASGVLFDNVRIDGGCLSLVNRWTQPPGAGWSAANCVLWQCQAAIIRAFRPPTANNWVLAYWAEPQGDAMFFGQSDFFRPISLFQAQLRARLGEEAANSVEPLLLDPIASTNPTLAEAAEFVAQSNTPARTLREVIEQRLTAAGVATRDKSREGLATATHLQSDNRAKEQTPLRPIEIVNGWIAVDGRVLTGGHLDPTWWRGTLRPDDAETFGPSITRFAPGRYGTGLTDELEEVVQQMQTQDQVVYDHHYGLWYDRRRDDHLMVRRATSDVAPPFFEQPFARSGSGTAWDGLSRYDLTKFNKWYWRRLQRFAQLCDQHGLILFHQHYFQHNILEAGAHWADSPWRPTNNVNSTGFPEPPPYIGDKRIFLAREFYDTMHAKGVALHQSYIRQCLENFANQSNVIHSISAEYTGPLAFTEFWLDEVARWTANNSVDPVVALATTKDVQDAILANEKRAEAVDVIDIRYWCYDKHGELYAPAGGVHLAPRQHLRQAKVASGSMASVARAVREYRLRFPQKAITYYADLYCRSHRDGWAVLMGGGSLADVPPLPEALERALLDMMPAEDSDPGLLQLANPGKDYLIYLLEPSRELELELPAGDAAYNAVWISPETGAATQGEPVPGGRSTLEVQQQVLWLSSER